MIGSDVAIKLLTKPNAVGVIPTDTVYGIVSKASDQNAVQRLYQLKSRIQKPGTLLAYDIDQLVQLGLKRKYLTPFTKYWPNPLSVVIPCNNLSYLHQGLNSLAVRIPKNEFLRNILQKTGPLMSTSANLPSQPESKTIQEAKAYFGDKVDFYLDGGNLSNNKPSTIIQLIDDEVVILRQGEYIFKP